MYKDGPFGSLLELAGVEEGSLDLADVEIFDASQRYPRKYTVQTYLRPRLVTIINGSVKYIKLLKHF